MTRSQASVAIHSEGSKRLPPGNDAAIEWPRRPYDGVTGAAAVGAAIGAIIGAAVGNPLAGAVLGAVVGGIVGDLANFIFGDLFGGSSDTPPTPRKLLHGRHPLYPIILGVCDGVIPNQASAAPVFQPIMATPTTNAPQGYSKSRSLENQLASGGFGAASGLLASYDGLGMMTSAGIGLPQASYLVTNWTT